ncbi:EamA family transporter [Chitiniphilus eburneus]|uniref:EamA family transporter n=1 Tax=Chitiniphilus eburneus TaxID=2571148 RepID=A0A4U0PWM8_9NEIS|nr:EamA family transporter [Chitiniphilus eburneus]TJZ72963.1 EamA family transporter [Chitiniphilus eburneus]
MPFSSLRPTLGALAMALAAIASIQAGAAIAKSLFPLIGAQGTVALRLGLGTLLLLAWMRPWRQWPTRAAWRVLVVYGVALGAMNSLFYLALRSVPLGVAVALEFTGPLAVAILGSRRPIDGLWALLAVAGLLGLLPLGQHGAIDLGGALYALGAGICWALYILYGQRAGAAHGLRSVSMGSAIAALLVVPAGVAHAGPALFSPTVLALGLAVAILSTALPYTLEMIALSRLPARLFGILQSLGPAFGTLAGLALLGEQPSLSQALGIAAIVAASIGAASTTQSR